jgi:hypothetical protein
VDHLWSGDHSLRNAGLGEVHDKVFFFSSEDALHYRIALDLGKYGFYTNLCFINGKLYVHPLGCHSVHFVRTVSALKTTMCQSTFTYHCCMIFILSCRSFKFLDFVRGHCDTAFQCFSFVTNFAGIIFSFISSLSNFIRFLT